MGDVNASLLDYFTGMHKDLLDAKPLFKLPAD